jgi:PAS domain S-box-containing protein
MKKQTNKLTDAAILRQKAEEQLKLRTDARPCVSKNETDLLKLIHELEVHQIELEMQNEELVIAKEKAELAEEKYTELYDFAPSGYLSLSKDGKIAELNFVAAKMLGKERSLLQNSVFGFFVSAETKPAFNHFLAEVFRSKTKAACEVTLTVDGRLPMHVILSGICHENGQHCKLTAIDITERKQAEEVKMIDEEKIRFQSELLRNAPMIAAFHDKDLNMVWANIAYEKAVGSSLKDIAGKKCYSVWNLSGPCQGCPVLTAIATGKSSAAELTPQNQKHWPESQGYWLSKASPVRDKEGNIIGAIETAIDITELKQVEEALRKSLNDYQNLVENTPDIIYSMNSEGQFTFVSNNVSRYGFTPEEMIGHHIQEYIHPDYIAKVLDDFSKSFELEVSPRSVFRLVSNENANLWLEDTSRKLIENDQVIGFTGIIRDITERKQAEKEIEKQKEFLRKVIDTIPAFVCVKKIDGSYELANKALCDAYGTTPERLEGHKDSDFSPQDEEVEAFLQDDLHVINTKKILHIPEEVITYADGSIHWLSTIKSPIIEQDGSCKKLLAIAMDITERKETENTKQVLFQIANEILHNFKLDDFIKAVEQQLSKLVDTTNFYIALYDAETGMLSAPFEKDENDQIDTWQSKGSATGLVIEKKQSVLLKKQDVLGLIESSEIEQTGSICESWLGVPLFKGTDVSGVIVVQSYDNPEAFDSNTVALFEYVSNQISMALERTKIFEDLLHAKNKAEESERELNLLFENIPQGFAVHEMIYDKDNKPVDYRFLKINKEFEKLTGINSNDIINKTVKEVLPNTEQIWIDNYGKVAQAGIPLHFDSYSQEFNKYYDVTAYSPKQDCFAVVFSDVTKNKEYEQNLKKALEKAEESDRLKSAFLANMSHEIRTPMNGILGFAELLQNMDLTGDERQKYISIINKSGQRMLNIINDIVDISRIEAGLVELNMRESNINEIIEYVYTFFKPEAETKSIKLSYKTLLPANKATIITDCEKVYAVLTNLVKNAIKYTEKGEIELGYAHNDDFFEFYVKDTGIGIPKERQEAIFERFIQADIEDKMARQGAGLGLGISKAYVEMLGGKIWLDSEEGIGSTFYFTLPCDNEPKKENIANPPAPSVRKDDIRKLKTLIVEDDLVSEMLFDKTVKIFSKETLKARTGAEAVEACKKNPDIDLVLMDIRMPGMNGYEATKQIREFNKEVIIIAQTAYGQSGDREKAINAGCDDYIAKPIDRDKLLALIQKYFGE